MTPESWSLIKFLMVLNKFFFLGHPLPTFSPHIIIFPFTDGGMWEKGSDGFMYRYSVEPKPFSEAQATCVKWGGNLVMEKTPETRVYVSKSYNARNIWCGVKKDLKRKGFVYVDGGKIKKSYWRKVRSVR